MHGQWTTRSRSAEESSPDSPTGGRIRPWEMSGYGGQVRLTDFHERIAQQFGTVTGDSMLVDHLLLSLGNRTAAQAIEDGEDPRDVWRALCAEFDVPRSLW